MNSDEHFAEAVKALQETLPCQEWQAQRIVRSIAGYISRLNDEIVNHYGPAHEFAQSRGI